MSDNLNKFNVDISSFRNDSLIYVYSFDSVGNLFFKDSGEIFNQTFLKKNNFNYSYDETKLSQFYTLDFEEFLPGAASDAPSVDFSALVSSLNDQVQSLQDQLFAVGIDSAVVADLIANSNNARDVIISLRILLGQGTTEADFSEEFPYLPLNAPAPATGSREPIVFPTESAQISPSNPLAIFDLNSDFILDKKEIKNIQQQYKIGNPVLLDTLKRKDNTLPLSKTDLQFIIDTFYRNVAKIETKTSLLSKFDVDGNFMLSKKEIKTLKKQYKIGNPVVTSFNTDGKKGLSKTELLTLERAILTPPSS